MGLSGGKSDKTFVTINNGQFVVRVLEGTEGAEPRVLTKGKNEGKTVYELRYSQLSGMIDGIRYTKKEFGDFIEIDVNDGDEYVLQIPWSAFNIRDNFIKALPNIDPFNKVEFVVFKDKESDRTVFLTKQNGAWVKFKYTKEDPNGMPEAKKKNVRGEDKWDFSEVEDFMFSVLEEHMKVFNTGNVLAVGGDDDLMLDDETEEKAPEWSA